MHDLSRFAKSVSALVLTGALAVSASTQILLSNGQIETLVKTQECGAKAQRVLSGRCVPDDSLALQQHNSENLRDWHLRGAEVMQERNLAGAEVQLLLLAMEQGSAPDSLRLWLADALFRDGRYEEALEVNYALDRAQGSLRIRVLEQRQEQLQILGLEAAAQSVLLELDSIRPVPSVWESLRWTPWAQVGWQLTQNNLEQSVDTSQGLQGLSASVERSNSTAIVQLLDKQLSKGFSYRLPVGVGFRVQKVAWWLGSDVSGSLSFPSDLTWIRTGSGRGTLDVGRDGPLWNLQVSVDAGRIWYARADGYWSQDENLSLLARRRVGKGSWGQQMSLSRSTSSQDGEPSWSLSWSQEYRSKAPRVSWLQYAVRTGLSGSWDPAIEYWTPTSVQWCENLSNGGSILNDSILHFANQNDSVPVRFRSFLGLRDLPAEQVGDDLLIGRSVAAQITPQLGGDLVARLPKNVSISVSGSLSVMRFLERPVMNNILGAHYISGDTLAVWIDRKTGTRYVYADPAGSSLQEIRDPKIRYDIARSVSLTTRWSSAIWGSVWASTSYTYSRPNRLRVAPTSEFTSWSLSSGWNRSW